MGLTYGDPVERICAAIRGSFPGAEVVYTRGGCWAFFVFLRTVFPEAKPLYDAHIGHVFTEIDGRVYDINGRRRAGVAGLEPMTRNAIRDAHRWAGRSFAHLGPLIALHMRLPMEVSYDASL